MKDPGRISIIGILYSATVVTGFTGYCWAGIFDCKVGSNLRWSEIIVPLVVLTLLMMLIGLFVAVAVDYLSRKSFFRTGILTAALMGAVIGIIPRVLVGLFAQPFGSGIYPHVEYLPFAIGGIVAAVARYMFSRTQSSVGSAA